MERHRTLWSCSEPSVSCHVEQKALNQRGENSNTIIPGAWLEIHCDGSGYERKWHQFLQEGNQIVPSSTS